MPGSITEDALQVGGGDVDREQGMLTVRWKGSKVRRLTLGQQALRHLLVYLDGYRLPGAAYRTS